MLWKTSGGTFYREKLIRKTMLCVAQFQFQIASRFSPNFFPPKIRGLRETQEDNESKASYMSSQLSRSLHWITFMATSQSHCWDLIFIKNLVREQSRCLANSCRWTTYCLMSFALGTDYPQWQRHMRRLPSGLRNSPAEEPRKFSSALTFWYSSTLN